MDSIEIPICERGFLTSIKKSPKAPIHKLTLHAKDVCAGLAPDYNGKKFKSPLYQIKQITQIKQSKDTTEPVRPLLPTHDDLKRELKDRFKKYVVINNMIIGMSDVDNRLYLIRPIKK